MIGTVLLVILFVFLGGTAALGLWFRAGRGGPFDGILVPVSKIAPWFVLAGAAIGLMFMRSLIGFVWGAVGGAVLSVVAAGWDEFFDRVATGFYASFRRELYSFFSTPIPYFVLLLYTLLTGFFFWVSIDQTQSVTMRFVFSTASGLGFFLFPLLTMGLFAQERSEGTIEVLMTAPISDTAVTASKFLATLTFYLVMLAPSIVYVAILRYMGIAEHEIGKPDAGPLVTSYLGLVLAAGFYISLGIFTSALTTSQILSALLSWVLIIFFMITGDLPRLLGVQYEWTGDVLTYLDPARGHLEPFLKGVIDGKDVVFYLSFTVFFLFLAVRTIESRKWR